ncbi:MAG: hypothetical protein Q8O55_09495 [Dehalococcoidales bacterium]|nr:hypothetical protein [Dehalococcoidales bacterium]MDZ4246708.1 hypothetical protein [Dehalococcoidia bacterium]
MWQKVLNIITLGRRGGSCHGEGLRIDEDGLRKVIIVGSPNGG